MKFTEHEIYEIKTLYNIYKSMYSYDRICTLLAIKYICNIDDIKNATKELYDADIEKGFFV